MKTFKLSWGVALLGLLAILLVVTAPARLLQLVLPGNQVQLAGLQGTLWSGSASRAVIQLAPGYLHLGAVQWSLKPLSLLTLSPRLTLHSEWGGQRLHGDITVRSEQALDVADLEAQASADLVRNFAPLAVDGFVSVQLEHLALRGGLPHSAQGRAVWQEAGFQSPRGRIPLGSFALDFAQAEGEALRGEVVTLNGPLQVQGNVQLQGRKYGADLLLSSEGDMEGALQQALRLMAQPEGDGFRLRLNSEF